MSSDGPSPRKRLRFPAPRDTRSNARRVVLGLGSNSDAEVNIAAAVDALTHTYDLLVKSTRYVGPPEVAPEDGLPVEDAAIVYSNTAVLVRTADSYDELRVTLRAIEADLGRDRSTPAIVAIDIDILLIEDEVVRTPEDRILVPHPDLSAKRHAAIPAAEVAPSLRHPRTGERLSEVAARLA